MPEKHEMVINIDEVVDILNAGNAMMELLQENGGDKRFVIAVQDWIRAVNKDVEPSRIVKEV